MMKREENTPMSKRKFENQKKRRIPLNAYLGYLLIVTLAVTGITFSGYVTKSTGEDSARVARFVVTAESVEQATFNFSDLIPGDTCKWEFDVEFDSEVAAQCKMLLTSTGNLPLEYTLTHNETTKNVTLSEPLDIYQVAAGYKGTQTFILTVTWDENDNNIEYMGMADAVTLSITTEQID